MTHKVQTLPLVERTAMAIYETDVQKATKPIAWINLSDLAHDRYRQMACAALSVALAEPVEVMSVA